MLPGTGIPKGPKRCEWQHAKENLLLSATSLGTKETSHLPLDVKCLQGNRAQQKLLSAVGRRGLRCRGYPAGCSRGVGTNSPRGACRVFSALQCYWSVFVFILHISAFLKFRLGVELVLDSVISENKTPQNPLLLFIQSWKSVNQK